MQCELDNLRSGTITMDGRNSDGVQFNYKIFMIIVRFRCACIKCSVSVCCVCVCVCVCSSSLSFSFG